jgi:hypothetical protein
MGSFVFVIDIKSRTMHDLLGDQTLYFPSFNDRLYSLKAFLMNKYQQECHLPVIVKIKSLKIPRGAAKDLLQKNTPLLLLNIDELHYILAEHCPTNRYHIRLPVNGMKKKFRDKKRTSKQASLVTFADVDDSDEFADSDNGNRRIMLRTLNEKHSSSVVFCRIPMNYSEYIELLNENDQSIEPYHRLADLLIDQTKDETRSSFTDECSHTFLLRSPCTVYTRKYFSNERKPSCSGDSCYGSLSDLESHENLLILNSHPQILEPGQIITILNICSAYRGEISDDDTVDNRSASHSSAAIWLQRATRWIFSRRSNQLIPSNKNCSSNTCKQKDLNDKSSQMKTFLKCRTEQGNIIYISPDISGRFSPIYSPTTTSSIMENNPSLNISGVFRLEQLIHHFHFPISIRLLNSSLSFDNVFLPNAIHQQDSSSISSTRFRCLIPYAEPVVFACPLVMSSSFKSRPIVIPIPIDIDMKVQICLNMREIIATRSFHDLLHICSDLVEKYQTNISCIHFPLELNTKFMCNRQRTTPLFKKRSQSCSRLQYSTEKLSKRHYRRSCEVLSNYEHGKDEEPTIIEQSDDHLIDGVCWPTMNSNRFKQSIEKKHQQTMASSAYHYAQLKLSGVRRLSQKQEFHSDDEKYHEIDHIYDYIRSGDLTDDMKRILQNERISNSVYQCIIGTASNEQNSIVCDGSIKVCR